MALPTGLVEQFAGSWTGAYRLWLEPDVLADECTSQAHFGSVAGGSFLTYDYDWSYEGTRQSGFAMLGRDGEGVYQMAWTDTWHNGESIMLCTGTDPDPIVLGTYGPPETPWGWRTEFAVVDSDHVTVTAWNITPDGTEMKATEADYARASSAAAVSR